MYCNSAINLFFSDNMDNVSPFILEKNQNFDLWYETLTHSNPTIALLVTINFA